jgi:hypothetical protein
MAVGGLGGGVARVRTTDVERWVVQIVDRVQSGGRVEDSRVELKAEVPPPEKAAVRLGAHANTAGGEPILWIIGLHETQRTFHSVQTEPASWLEGVVAQFEEGVAPGLLADVHVPVEGGVVWALYFETGRSPYVVKNESKWVVPVREGTRWRNARRIDLLRIFNAVALRPEIEVVGATATFDRSSLQEATLAIKVLTFWMPLGSARIVVPFHRCNGEVSTGEQTFPLLKVEVRPQRMYVRDDLGSGRHESVSSGARYAEGSCTVLEAVNLQVVGRAFISRDALTMEDRLLCRFRLPIAGSREEALVEAGPMMLLPRSAETIYRWGWLEHDRVSDVW